MLIIKCCCCGIIFDIKPGNGVAGITGFGKIGFISNAVTGITWPERKT